MSTLSTLNPIVWGFAWAFVTIAGVDSPGVIPKGGISGADREYKYDTKAGKGTKGATSTFVAIEPAKFSIKFLLWDDGTLGTGRNHFEEWDAFVPLLKYDPTKKAAQAFTIFHPGLASIDINSVVTTKLGMPVDEGEGLWSVTVEFLEYFPASKTSVVSTPKGAKWVDTTPGGKGTPPGTTPDPAIEAAQKQIDELSKQAQAAAA